VSDQQQQANGIGHAPQHDATLTKLETTALPPEHDHTGPGREETPSENASNRGDSASCYTHQVRSVGMHSISRSCEIVPTKWRYSSALPALPKKTSEYTRVKFIVQPCKTAVTNQNCKECRKPGKWLNCWLWGLFTVRSGLWLGACDTTIWEYNENLASDKPFCYR
jgi:hypothetical protein